MCFCVGERDRNSEVFEEKKKCGFPVTQAAVLPHCCLCLSLSACCSTLIFAVQCLVCLSVNVCHLILALQCSSVIRAELTNFLQFFCFF